MKRNVLQKNRSWFAAEIKKPQISLSDAQPIQVWDVCHQKRGRSSFDMHYGLELGIVLSGCEHRYYRKWQSEIGAGELWFGGMWEPHGYEILRAPCRAISIVILPQMLARFAVSEAPGYNWLAPFTAEPSQRPQTLKHLQSRICQLAECIAQVARKTTPEAKIMLRLLVLELLVSVRETWSAPARLLPAEPDSYALIEKTLEHIYAHSPKLTTQQAARLCGLNRNSFARLFQNVMGISFSDFSLRYRLHSARSQLVNSPDPLKKIAYDWDFTDASHFCRCFSKYFGTSPGTCRKRKNFNIL